LEPWIRDFLQESENNSLPRKSEKPEEVKGQLEKTLKKTPGSDEWMQA